LPAAFWRVRDLLFALRSGGLQPGAPRQGNGFNRAREQQQRPATT
jgi:hypothetical protein